MARLLEGYVLAYHGDLTTHCVTLIIGVNRKQANRTQISNLNSWADGGGYVTPLAEVCNGRREALPMLSERGTRRGLRQPRISLVWHHNHPAAALARRYALAGGGNARENNRRKGSRELKEALGE